MSIQYLDALKVELSSSGEGTPGRECGSCLHLLAHLVQPACMSALHSLQLLQQFAVPQAFPVLSAQPALGHLQLAAEVLDQAGAWLAAPAADVKGLLKGQQ